jgi:hypothetical protein
VEDNSCSHILYAACHDSGYLSQLVPYTGHRDKITLVQGAGFNSDFHQFSLNVTQFPTIFRWSELSTVPPTKASVVNATERNGTPIKMKGPPKNAQNYNIIQNESSWRNNGANSFGADNNTHIGSNGFSEAAGDDWTNSKTKPEAVCKYYQKVNISSALHVQCTNNSKGFCRFGNKCKFQHIPSHAPAPETVTSPIDRSNIASVLPTHSVPGFIPLNKDNHRLDIFIPVPTPEAWIIYNARFHRQKPCNDHYLQGMCTKFPCPFDHTTLEPQARYCLEYVVKCSPCPRRGACRSATCVYGHLCQKNDCMGQMKGCRMKMEQHRVDPVLASMVPAEEEEEEEEGLTHDDLVAGPAVHGVGEQASFW